MRAGRFFSAMLATLLLTSSAMATGPEATPAAGARAAGHSSAPASAAAPTPAQLEEARARYDRGVQLYAEGDYKLALIEFERANEIAPSLATLFNIAQVNYQLNNFAKALTAYKQYLKEGGDKVPADRRKQVENDIAQLRSRTAYITVTSNVESAEVMIDDVAIGKAPVKSLLVDAGQHRIVVSAPGFANSTKVLTLAAQDDLSLPMQLVEEDKPKPVEEKKHYTWIGWVATGVLAAGAVGTGIATLTSYGDFKDAKQAAVANNDPDGSRKRQNIDDLASETRTLALVSTVLTGAAVVAGAVTLYFTVKKSSDSSVRVGVAPQGVMLGGTF